MFRKGEEVVMIWRLLRGQCRVLGPCLLLLLRMAVLPLLKTVIIKQTCLPPSGNHFLPSHRAILHSLLPRPLTPFSPLPSFNPQTRISLLINTDINHRNTNTSHLIYFSAPMHPQGCDFVFKILLIGNSSVGKTSLLSRFAEQVFHEELLSTIGVDLKIRTIRQAGGVMKLQMWDTAGQQRFKALSPSSYKDTQGMILVFDLADRKSFEDISSWLDEADRHSNPESVRILVGNKSDLHTDRQVSSAEAQRYAEKEGMIYYQTSAKDNTNVTAVFERLSGQMKQRFSEQYLEKYKKTKVYLTPIVAAKGRNINKTCC